MIREQESGCPLCPGSAEMNRPQERCLLFSDAAKGAGILVVMFGSVAILKLMLDRKDFL